MTPCGCGGSQRRTERRAERRKNAEAKPEAPQHGVGTPEDYWTGPKRKPEAAPADAKPNA